MNACPNCGAELKFDIQSQMLACPFCGAKVDPASYTEFGAAAEENHISMAEASSIEEGMAADVLHASQVVNTVQSGNEASGSSILGPSGGAQGSGMLGPSGSFASSGGVGFAGGSFMSQGTGASGSFASQGGATPSGAGFAGTGNSVTGVSDSFASQTGAAPIGGGFMQQGGSIGGSTGFAAAGSSTAAAAQSMAAASFLGSVAAAENAAIGGGDTAFPGGGQPQPVMNNGAFVYAQPGMSGPTQQVQEEPLDPNFDPTANYQELEVISYSCPQCGGSIYSTDESVNGFCSFCGSNITLQSRMARMKYPKYVLPFRVNKNACKQYYLNHVKKAFFAPKELKNPEYLERFRGIYMPYWGYDVMMYGNVMLHGTHSYRRGDYIITEHYNCSGLVDAFYKGLSYDASSSFDDHFSEQIAPFDAHAMIEFNPAYLSGFYADLQDVSYHVYEQDAIRFGQKQILNSIRQKQVFAGASFAENQENMIHPTIDARHDGVYTAFFPVWFLSYRNKDRIAYAVVNGQTGKLISDLPVDKKKFILSAFLMSIPIFFLLMMLPVLRPAGMILLAEVFSVISVVMLVNTVKKVLIRDQRLDDRGYLSKYDRMNYNLQNAQAEQKAKKQKTISGSAIAFIVLFCAFGPLASMAGEMFEAFFSGNSFGLAAIALILAVVLVVINASGTKMVRELAEKGTGLLIAGIWMICAACLYGGIVILANPVSDIPYYIGVVILFAGTLMAQLMALEQYNLLTTRPLPQLNRKGGDDSAQD